MLPRGLTVNPLTVLMTAVPVRQNKRLLANWHSGHKYRQCGQFAFTKSVLDTENKKRHYCTLLRYCAIPSSQPPFIAYNYCAIYFPHNTPLYLYIAI